MAWQIIAQTEKHGKEEIPVKCKHVKFFPLTDGGGNVEGFGKLNRLVFRIVVRNSKGYELKLTAHGDMMDPMFNITHPDKVDYPTIWVGEGKRRRKVIDDLSAKITYKGEKEKYPYLMDFEARCTQMFGAEMKEEIMRLFIDKFASLASV